MDRLSPERRISLLRAVKIAILHRSYASEGSFIDSDIDFASYEMNAIESSYLTKSIMVLRVSREGRSAVRIEDPCISAESSRSNGEEWRALRRLAARQSDHSRRSRRNSGRSDPAQAIKVVSPVEQIAYPAHLAQVKGR